LFEARFALTILDVLIDILVLALVNHNLHLVGHGAEQSENLKFLGLPSLKIQLGVVHVRELSQHIVLFGFLSDTALVFLFLFFKDDFRFELLCVNLEATLALSCVLVSILQQVFLGRLHFLYLAIKQLF